MSSGQADRPAPPPGQGSIVGTVVNAANARPIVGATVQLAGGDEVSTRTDVDGRFTLFVAPGTYRIRVTAPLYGQTTVENVAVSADRSTTADASLTPRVGAGVEVVDVVADVTEATEATQLLKRKLAPSVGETLGAESISRTPDSDAAEVVTRVPAVTIKDDKFIVVRGLSERYSSAQLNGSRLPSTDPNRRIVPLDLFPADFIESLTLVKTYTPDLPGDFAGGLIDIKLTQPSKHLTYGLGLTLGVNTETTFQRYETYDSTAADWFALGDSYRDLPGIFGDGDIGGNLPTQQQRAYVSSLRQNWDIHGATAPPNFGIDASVSNSWGPFGFNLAANYGWKFAVLRDKVENSFVSADDIPDLGELFTYDESAFEVQMGAVLTLQYDLSKHHKLFGRSLVNRRGLDEVETGSGEDVRDRQGVEQFPTSTLYTTDTLGFGQLEGRHHFSLLDVDWRASWAPSSEDQPDGKFYVYEIADAGTAPVLTERNPSTQRTFTNLSEFLQDYYVDFVLPFRTRLPFTDVWRGLSAQLKSGLAYSSRDRSFLFRSYLTRIPSNFSTTVLQRPPDQILIPRFYAAQDPFLHFEGSVYEPFDASQEIAAAYGMLELPLIADRLRLIAGARVEYSYLKTTSRDPRGSGEGQFRETIINDLDPLPSVNLIYSPLDDMNVRLAYSQTVSRPEFRELTPTRLPVLPGERPIQGNPELISADITNYDVRWEWFFSPLELVSVSFFYKDLTNPIERVTAFDVTTVLDTFVNSTEATVWGFEFEGRKDLSFVVPYARKVQWMRSWASAFADIQFQLNVSVVESEVPPEFTRPPGTTIAPIQENRALQGQSPYVINALVEYEHYTWGVYRLLYNTVGPTIDSAGTEFMSGGGRSLVTPDIIDERRDALDFVWLVPIEPFGVPLTAKFAVENILNDRFLETQGSGITSRYRSGVTFSMGASYSF